MDNYSFFALASRMKYINRWGLMRNSSAESLTEHSAETAILAHALALIGNKYFGKSFDANFVMSVALYHDITEVYTGDMPTPVKYFNSEIKSSYKEIEKSAALKILSKLPCELMPEFENIILCKDKEVIKLVKAADKLSALIKCKEELNNGNPEFKMALEATSKRLSESECEELDYFLTHFSDSYTRCLDEL